MGVAGSEHIFGITVLCFQRRHAQFQWCQHLVEHLGHALCHGPAAADAHDGPLREQGAHAFSVAAQGIFGQGIFIDPKRKLVIASNANWTRATDGPEGAARDVFYKQVQDLIDAEAAAKAPVAATKSAN